MCAAPSSRLHEKLEQCKQSRDFYQAHQISRTIYARLRPGTNDENILKFLFESACYFLENNQSNSGYDLCKSYVETLNSSNINELTDNLLTQICTLFQLLRPYYDERTEFACNVLRWSSQIPSGQPETEQLPNNPSKSSGSLSTAILSSLVDSNSAAQSSKRPVYHRFGHPKLHESFAHILWEQEKNYKDSRYHYLRSHDGRSFAIMLIEAHQTFGYPSEIDLFIAQTVLQYLLLRNFHTAYLVFVTYVERHPKIRQSPPGPFNNGYPMLNFLWFLLLCLKKVLIRTPINNNVASGEPINHSDALPSPETTRCFSSLVNAYKPSLERDSTLIQYVDRIGALFFGLKQKSSSSSSSSSNSFENLMNSLTANLSNGIRSLQQHQSDVELDFD